MDYLYIARKKGNAIIILCYDLQGSEKDIIQNDVAAAVQEYFDPERINMGDIIWNSEQLLL